MILVVCCYILWYTYGDPTDFVSQTHNVAMALPLADFVVSLGTDGHIVTQGTVLDALSKDSTLVEEIQKEEKEIASEIIVENEPSKAALNENKGKLILAEEVEEGHVSSDACMFNISVMG